MKNLFLWFHKWLGLITGIVIITVSFTGSIYVFQDELKLLAYPEKYFLETTVSENASPLRLSQLIEIAQKSLSKNEKVSRVDIHPQKNRTWVFRAVESNEDALFYWDSFIYHKRVFINPYTGKVQAKENSKTEFFNVVLQIHMNLLLGKKYGHAIIGFSTLFFGIISLTGLVLWWPKKWKKSNLKQSLLIKRGSKFKRLNYDLHNVLGFYALPVAVVFCFTGLVFSFPWFKNLISENFDSLNANKNKKIIYYKNVPQFSNNSLNNSLTYVLKEHPTADQLSIRLQAKEKPHNIQVRLLKNKTSVFYWYYFNQENGQIENIKSSNKLGLGSKITSLNYDLHTGTIGGLTTKMIALLASLICTSLPITGFIIWLNKSKKTRKRNLK